MSINLIFLRFCICKTIMDTRGVLHPVFESMITF